MGRYAKAGQVDAAGKGEYFANLSAKYKVRVGECKAVEPREGGMATIIEVEVLDILLDPDEARDHEGKPKARVGDTRCWYLDMKKDAAWPDLQAFLALAHNIDKDRLELIKEHDKHCMHRGLPGCSICHGKGYALVQGPDGRTQPMGEMEQIAEWTVGPDQPLRGLELVVHTFNKNTKQKGRPFTVHRWYSADGVRSTAQDSDEIPF